MPPRAHTPWVLRYFSLALLLGAGTAATAQQPSVAAAPVGGLRIVNRSPTPLTLEVRTAVGTDCAKGDVVRTQTIAAGATVVIRSSQALCIRRETLDATTGRRVPRAWERKALRPGVIEEVIL